MFVVLGRRRCAKVESDCGESNLHTHARQGLALEPWASRGAKFRPGSTFVRGTRLGTLWPSAPFSLLPVTVQERPHGTRLI